jgi:phosphoglycerol transferase MdoB-like AlkP superfamily enzyme
MLTDAAQSIDLLPGRQRANRAQRLTVGSARLSAVAVLYLLLPNLPMLLSIGGLGALPHGYINVECLLIGAVGVLLPRGLVFALLVLELLVDFAYSLCYTYKFTLAELLASLRYLPVLPRGRVLAGLAVLALGILFCAALALVRPRRGERLFATGALLLCMATLSAIDMADGQNFLWRKDVTFSSLRLVRSPLLVLAVWEAAARRMDAQSLQPGDVPMASASSHAISFLDNRQNVPEAPNVVLIVVESWGLARDPALAGQLTEAYDDPRIALRYRVSHGSAPFSGLTVPGEARELCHSTLGFGILRATPDQIRQCLPARLHARGYRSTAVHGYVGQMFYRSAWYPTLGFDRSWFGPDLAAQGLPRCGGAFPGVCDASIAAWIGSTLLSGDPKQPQFVYWVTLNSHLPVPAHPDLPGDEACAAQPILLDDAALCSWFRLVRTVHQSVRQLALSDTGRPTIFVLVGDHAPPFADPRLRQRFSGVEVPWVMLTPLSLQSAASLRAAP